MSAGIYCYKDTHKNDSIVYIGKDTNIDRNNRHNHHTNPKNYDFQQINRILQNNPERYEYELVCESEHYSDVYLNLLEKGLIKVFNPKFNFTKGGDGTTGFKHSDEAKKKMSLSKIKKYPRIFKKGFQNGKQVWAIAYDGKVIKQSHSLEYLEEYLNKLKNGKTKSEIEKTPKIIKRGFKYGKQVYAIKYDNKIIKQSFDLDKLELELSKFKIKVQDYAN